MRGGALALPAMLILLHACVADDAVEASAAERAARGEALYRTGYSSRGETLSAVIAGGVHVEGVLPPCASCHGEEGQGGEEGGVAIPSLRWRELTAPYGRRHSLGDWRPAYDEDTLARAIRRGIASSGAALDPLMPRFALPDEDMSDLLAYVRQLGSRQAVSEGAPLRVGVLTPLGGAFGPLGRARLAELRQVIGEVNEVGGVFGRAVELVPLDAERTGPFEVDDLLTLIVDVPSLELRLRIASLADTLPVLDLTPVNERAPRHGRAFHLAPSPSQRACAAAVHLARETRGAPGRILVISAHNEHERSLDEELERALARLDRQVDTLSPRLALERAAAADVSAIVEVGDGSALASLPRGRPGPVQLLIAAAPRLLHAEGASVITAAGSSSDAAAALVQALKIAGSAPTRERLASAFEQVTIGALGRPTVRFGRRRGLGAMGAWVESEQQGRRSSRWIAEDECGVLP